MAPKLLLAPQLWAYLALHFLNYKMGKTLLGLL